MSDLGAIFHVKKAAVQYDAHAYTTLDECPEPNLKIKFNGQQAYVKLVSKGTGDVPCYVKTKGGALFQILASPVKPQENFFVAKGQPPWYYDYWGDKTHVTNIDTSISGQAIVTCDANVTTMSKMFKDCSNLTELDLSHFDTSKVTSMWNTFNGCYNLKKLNLSNVDTSNVTTMYYMFNDCSNLTELDLSHFDTSKVTNMLRMFYACNSLTNIKGIIDMQSCEYYADMFYGCTKLTGVKIKNPPINFAGAGLNSSQYTIVS